tara:strand:- start:1747 stop:1956 length:210 start_codon:yes stop_codon:yes gene_type:complete
MPKTETYETLSNLQNKEIVCEIPGRPVMFEAKSLKETFKTSDDAKMKGTYETFWTLPLFFTSTFTGTIK